MSADGSVVGHRVRDSRSKTSYAVVGTTKGPGFDMVGLPVISSDGRTSAYWASNEDFDYFAIVNGVKDGPYDSVQDPVISGDGKVVAYHVDAVDDGAVMIGGREVPSPGNVRRIFLDHHGTKVGFVLRIPGDVPSFRVRTEAHAGEVFDEIGIPSFGPDGETVAYRARRGKTGYLVVGPRKFRAPGIVSDPVFEPGGKRVGYGARIGNDLWWRVAAVR